METIHYSNNKFIHDNEYVNTFVIINNSLDTKINSVNGFSIPLSEIDEYDVIFRADKITKHNDVLHIQGTIGYSFDPIPIKLIYNLKKNEIYIASNYRLLSFQQEYELYKNTYQISYDKYCVYDKDNIEENVINEQYEEIKPESIPYYRFPRSKDGISIPRVIYNIFKVFSNETLNEEKPDIIIPICFNVYRKLNCF